MKAIILQHSASVGPGSTVQWLQQKEIPYEVVRLDLNQSIPESIDFDTLFICGGGMNVDEEALYPWLKTEKEFIRSCLQSNVKIIGLCLGGQLLAEALGARVARHPIWESGWQKVSLLPTPDLQIPSAPGSIQALEWHGYSFEIPSGAHHFAANDICKNQGFAWKNQALGFQFHPEATLAWIHQLAELSDYPTTGVFQSPQELLSDSLENQARLQEWYFGILNNFLIENWQHGWNFNSRAENNLKEDFENPVLLPV